MRVRRIPLIFAGLLLSLHTTKAQSIKEEIDVGFASIEAVRPILKQVLSPTGRFVLLPAKGSVLVIDDPEHIAAAKAALAGGALPNPVVALQFAFRTGLPRRTRIVMGQEVMFPTSWDPPQISTTAIGPGPFPVTPAHPTNFVKRTIGVTSDSVATVNPDGSVTMDINVENSQFEGFVNYGSTILPAGGVGVIPVNGQVGNPGFFQPLIPNHILLLIIGTTRISTSVVVRPRVEKGIVNVDMIPRFTVFDREKSPEGLDVNLKQFGTTVSLTNNGVGRAYGFQNAGEAFNRHFLGARDVNSGGTAIAIKASVTAGKPEEQKPQTAPY